MDIAEEQVGDWVTVSPSGKINFGTSAQFREKLQSLYNKGARRFIIDLDKVSYISSVGLRVLLELGKKVKKEQGFFILQSPNANVYQVFEDAGFSLLFQLCHSAKDTQSFIKQLSSESK